MKILIIGLGRVGSILVDILSYEKIDILVIDKNSGTLPEVRKSNVKYINKDILEDNTINEINFAEYDYVLAVTVS